MSRESVYAARGLTVATESSTKKASGSMGNVTSHSLPGFCLATISNARSMLSACTITLKRAGPLLTWTEILIISHTFPLREDRENHHVSIILHVSHCQ
jgi:hypothetical protein